ncbi:MAG: TIGR01212 family radical SAM protein [Clostridia bacterium]|nr:TIGR01212 family radical SAM protein [Clostridia bacterium]
MQRYNSLNTYLKNRFGTKVYKLAVSGDFTCPNRDGKCGVGGCVFCSGGSGDFAAKGQTLHEQLETAKALIASKVNADAKYICYFQSYTNTYGTVEKLRETFLPVLEEKDIVAISIGTRPDCLEDDKIEFLSELNKQIPVIVELGLQTSNEKTAELINRCYKNDCFVSAVKRLKDANIEVVTHIILGLPGETEEDMLSSVEFACNQNIDGIKLQLLHVLKGTRLAEMNCKTLTMDEYFDILGACIEIIPPQVVLHRITGDGNKKELIAPLWSADKHNTLNELNKFLEKNNIVQGSKRR